MLKIKQAFSGFSVDDLPAAKQFYEQVLGLETDSQYEDYGLLALKVGAGPGVFAYAKGDGHRPATYTVLNFPVDDIEKTVDELTGRGVRFERYEGFEQDERGVSRSEGEMPAIAWFTDPAGNIFSLLEE